MSDQGDPQDRARWARLRFSIIGPLLAAPPERGELHAALVALSTKTWRHPVTGMPLDFGRSTIERWYYAARAAKQDPVAALKTRVRADCGQQRGLTPALIAALAAQYHAHPSWSAQLHYDNLRAALGGEAPRPSYSTLRRHMKAQGWFKQGRVRRHPTPGMLAASERLQRREVRSFELDHVNALWHLDFHYGSRKVLTRHGTWLTPMALAVLDDRSRLACHVQWYRDESAESLVHGFSQALQRRGLPRALMTDNGAAMMAEEFAAGLHQLGIVHQTTLPYSPYQKEWAAHCTSCGLSVDDCRAPTAALVLMLVFLWSIHTRRFEQTPSLVIVAMRAQEARSAPDLDGIGGHVEAPGDLGHGEQSPLAQTRVSTGQVVRAANPGHDVRMERSSFAGGETFTVELFGDLPVGAGIQ